MRTFKKIIAILVTLTMLLSVAALTANAGTAPTVKLVGRTQVANGDSYVVDFLVTGAETGGVQGTITYNTDAFDYVGTEFSAEFGAVNKITDNVVKVDETNGTIAFIGLNPGNDVVWFTLEFTAKGVSDEAALAVGNDVLTLKASDLNGKTAYAEVFVELPATVEVVEPDQVNMAGATIKNVTAAGKQDLRFATNIKWNDEIVEYGVIFIPAQLLPKGVELNCDPATVYGTNKSGKPIKAAVASSTKAIGEDFTLYATLAGSASFNAGALIQVDIVARAYVKLADGSVIYSNNDTDDRTNIDNGYATKSIIGVAKSMATAILTQTEREVTYNKLDKAAVEALIAKVLLDKNDTVDEPADLFAFIKDNAKILYALQQSK